MAKDPPVEIENNEELEFQNLNDNPDQEDELPVDVSKLSWPGFILHVTCLGGKKTLAVIDTMGEYLADLFGITGPKYWYIIEEYERQKSKEIKDGHAAMYNSDQILEGGVSD